MTIEQKFEVLREYESGAVDDWEWVGTLSVMGRDDYAFLLEQEPQLECSDSHMLKRFSTGEELVEFVSSAWWDGNFEYWQEVIEGIAKINAKLAQEVIKAIEEPEDEEPSPEELWAARATWERSKLQGGGAQWASMAEGIRGHAAILHYVRQFDGLPTGLHHVRVSFGSLADGADCRPPPQVSQPGVFDREVTFPKS